jgi:hypothetical protein
MDIKLIRKSGVPKAEVEAHQQIQHEFSTASFSKGWRGYASFAISRGGRGAGDDDLGIDDIDEVQEGSPMRVLLEKLVTLTPVENAVLVDVCERVWRGHENPLI